MPKGFNKANSGAKTLVVDLNSKYTIKVENAYNGKTIAFIRASILKVMVYPDDTFNVFFDDLETYSGILAKGNTLTIGD